MMSWAECPDFPRALLCRHNKTHSPMCSDTAGWRERSKPPPLATGELGALSWTWCSLKSRDLIHKLRANVSKYRLIHSMNTVVHLDCQSYAISITSGMSGCTKRAQPLINDIAVQTKHA